MNLETSQDRNLKIDGAFSDISHYCNIIDVADDFRLQYAGYRTGGYPKMQVFHSKRMSSYHKMFEALR